MASLALTYALGHEEEFLEEIVAEGIQAPYDFFVKLRDQPAAEDLPLQPSLYSQRTATLTSIVLGCQITVESETKPPCVELAESVLGALESLLSTSFTERVVSHEPVLTINVRTADFAERPFGFEMRDRDGRPHVEIRCGAFDPHSMSPEVQQQVKNKLFHLLVNILAHVFFVKSVDDVVSKLFGDELALERAINFTSSFVTLGNVLGHDTKTYLAHWVQSTARDYPLRRREEWDAPKRQAEVESNSSKPRHQPSFGKGELPAELQNPVRVKHTEMETVSFIRGKLWDEASWSGTAFFMSPDASAPPIIAPIFKNRIAAGQIFSHWRKEFGIQDTDERLRITVIRGISRTNPLAYRVLIGSNPATAFTRKDLKYAVMVFRMNTMEPANDRNLNGFLTAYKSFGAYFMAHAVLTDDVSAPEPVWSNYIVKRELNVRQAWEIGRHDVDSAGIRGDDDPIIPPDSDAPVIELLRWKRSQEG